MGHRWSETSQFITIEWDIISPLCRQKSLLSVIYSTILQWIPQLILQNLLPTAVGYNQLWLRSKSINGCPPKTANMAPLGCQFGSQQHRDDDWGSSDNSSITANGKNSWSGKHTDLYHLPHGYGYPPPLQPFAGALQFYFNSPFNMRRNSSQPTPFATEAQPSCGTPCEGYDIHQGG